MYLQTVFLAIFAVFVLSLVALTVVTHLRDRPGRTRSQRTMTPADVDVAAAALAHPDPDRRDKRPRRKRFWKPHWTSLRGPYLPNVTEQDD